MLMDLRKPKGMGGTVARWNGCEKSRGSIKSAHEGQRDMTAARLLLLGALAVSVGCAGGGGGGTGRSAASASTSAPSASTTALPLTQAQQAQAYLTAVAPGNAAVQKFRGQVTATSTQAQVAEAAKPLIAAFQDVDNALARIPFTGQAVTDVRSLIAVDGSRIGDFSAVGSQSAFSAASFATTLSRDAAAMDSAVAIVRADLGLPARPNAG